MTTLKELLNLTEITRRVHICKVVDDDGSDAYSISDEQITPKPLIFPDLALSYLKNNKPEILKAEVIMVSYRFWDDGKPFIEYLIK